MILERGESTRKQNESHYCTYNSFTTAYLKMSTSQSFLKILSLDISAYIMHSVIHTYMHVCYLYAYLKEILDPRLLFHSL